MQRELQKLRGLQVNILNYAANKRESFEKSPFNRVDAVILSWLSYYTYPSYVKGKKSVSLKNFEKYGLLTDKEMYAEAFSPKKSKKLFKLLTDNPRFENIRFFDFKDERDEASEKQFAAICIKISKNKYFLSFRGTDPSFTGWKEDFNLACNYPIPSQQAAVEYLMAEMKKFPEGEFYSGGHSKGGNIATYAAVNAGGELQKRIAGVFNFDGPGFINDVYSEEGYQNIAGRITKLVPQSSFVGMLFETRECYSIIKSRNLYLLQHDPFSWEIKDGDFCYLNDRSKFSIRLEQTVNNWFAEISIEERERLVDFAYSALTAWGMRDINEFNKNLYRLIPAIYKKYKDLESDDRTFFDEKIARLKQIFDNP